MTIKRGVLILGLLATFQFSFGEVNRFTLDSLRQQAAGINPDSVRLSAFLKIAELTANDDPELAIDFANSAVQLAKKTSDKLSEGLAHKWNGNAHYYNSDYHGARKEWSESLEIFQELEKDSYVATSLNNLGVLHKKIGEFSIAMKYFMDALRIREKMGNQDGVAVSYLSISSIHKEQRNYNSALDYLEKAKKIFSETGNQSGLAGAVNNIGLVYEIKGMYNEALESYTYAHEIYEMLDHDRDLAVSLNNIGTANKYLKNCETALEYYAQAIEIRHKLHDKMGVVSTQVNMGECYAELGDFKKALDYLQQAVNTSKEVGVYTHLGSAYTNIANTYYKMNEPDKAYKFSLLAKDMQDSLFNYETQRQIVEMEARYKAEKSAAESQKMQAELTERQSQLESGRAFRNFLIVLCVLAIIVVILLFSRFRYIQRFRKKLQKQNIEIARTNRDLRASRVSEEEKEVMLKEIHHRVKNNLQIISSLLRLQSATIEDAKVSQLFTECQNRIVAMALIHEKLYQSDDLANINIAQYVEELTDNLIGIYQFPFPIERKLDIAVHMLNVDTLIPIGLIINELVSNSLKHAFPGQTSGSIYLSLRQLPDKSYKLKVADNGVGLPENFNMDDIHSLGLELIQTLVSQLDGELHFESNNGTTFEITFGLIQPKSAKRSGAGATA